MSKIPSFQIRVPKYIPDSLKTEYLKWVISKKDYANKYPVSAKILQEIVDNGENNESK